MTPSEQVYQRLASDTVITGLVGDRIYPNSIPDHTTPTPWVFYTFPDGEPDGEQLDASEDGSFSLTVDVLAEDYDQGKALADAVWSRLHGWQGGQVKGAFWTGMSEQPVDEGYHFSREFTVKASIANVIPTGDGTARIVSGAGFVDIMPNGSGSPVFRFGADGTITVDGVPYGS